jgi:two-component sensor histidine kinase
MGPERHPSALGARGRECWDEIWDLIGPQIEYVMSGQGSTWDEERLVPVTRFGKREDVWWTYGYSPIDLEGGVGGVLVVCNDVSKQHLSAEALKNQTQRLEQLFDQAPGFVAVLRGPEHVFELTNTAYRRLTGPRAFMGRTVADVLPEVVDQGFIELLDSVYAKGQPHVGLRTPLVLQNDDGTTRNSVIDFVYQPIFELDGSVSGIFVQGTDVTELDVVETAFRRNELQLRLALEAAQIGVWECKIVDGSFLDIREDDRARRLLNRHEHESLHFEGFVARVHPDDRMRLQAASLRALDPAGDGILDVEYRMLSRHDMPERWIHARAQVVDADGVRKFVGTVRDISGLKATQAQQQLVSGELKHRIKNLLAMVSSIASQTLRGEDIAERRSAFTARLQVLAQAQDLLTASDLESGGMHATAHVALAPHGIERFDITGPDFPMNARQTLSMALALHELATNAMKYGALSNEIGRVAMSWTETSAPNGQSALRLRWEETGGPQARTPTKTGFGSRMISRVLAADFMGKVNVNYTEAGVVFTLDGHLLR